MIQFETQLRFTNLARFKIIWQKFIDEGVHYSVSGCTSAAIANNCVNERIPFTLEWNEEGGRFCWIIRTTPNKGK